MKNTNLTINERANTTEQAVALRIEAGENIDPREEIIVGDETVESIFASVDATRGDGFGLHRVHLVPLDRKNDVVRSVKVVKNGVLTETSPYIRLRFIDDRTGRMIDCASDKEHDDGIHYTTRLYAWMADGLRRNVDQEYAGMGSQMSTPQLLEFLVGHSINIWTRWDHKYMKTSVDFFDREAWEASKLAKSLVGVNSIKSSPKARVTENKAIR